MRSVATCFVTLMETTTTVPSTTYTTLTFSVYVYVSLRTSMYIYVSVLVNPSMIPICLARLRYLQPCRLFSKQSMYIYIKNMTPLQQRVRKTKKTPHGVDASGHRARAYLDGCWNNCTWTPLRLINEKIQRNYMSRLQYDSEEWKPSKWKPSWHLPPEFPEK